MVDARELSPVDGQRGRDGVVIAEGRRGRARHPAAVHWRPDVNPAERVWADPAAYLLGEPQVLRRKGSSAVWRCLNDEPVQAAKRRSDTPWSVEGSSRPARARYEDERSEAARND